MAQQMIALGNSPDGADGDDARTAFTKTNENFTELYQGIGGSQPASPKLSAIAASIWAANQLLIATGADTIGTLATGVTGRALVAANNAAEGRSAIAAQALHANLTGLSSIPSALNRVPFFTGTAGEMGHFDSTAFTREFMGMTDSSAARTKLALGSAATLTATTSTNDATAGRALRVGDFGLGGFAVELSSVDLNNIRTTGWWYIGGSAGNTANLPEATNGYLEVVAQSGAYILQRFHTVTTGVTYVRRCVNNSWQPWLQETYGVNSLLVSSNLNFEYNRTAQFNVVTANIPPSIGYGVVQTMWRNTSECIQVAYSVTSNNWALRRVISGSWTPWQDMTPLGVVQQWVQVTRNTGTTYTNDTGRPLIINYACQALAANHYLQIIVNGIVAAYSTGGYAAGGIIEISCLIPPGNTYSIASTAGVPVGPYATELR